MCGVFIALYDFHSVTWTIIQGSCGISDIRLKLNLNSNLAKSHSYRKSVSWIESYFSSNVGRAWRNYVQNFKAIWQFKDELLVNIVSSQVSLICMFDAYPTLHNSIGCIQEMDCNVIWCGTVDRNLYLWASLFAREKTHIEPDYRFSTWNFTPIGINCINLLVVEILSRRRSVRVYSTRNCNGY